MRDCLLVGDVREKLAEIPAGSVHCVVTSPPYWALRDYGVSGQLGSEASPEEYLANQIEVFRGVRRALRDDGVCWVNLGDNYNQYNAGRGRSESLSARVEDALPVVASGKPSVFPVGCQNLMPHRFALAMIADGWILRSTVIWSKRSPMPESISGWRWMRCRVKTASFPVAHPNSAESTSPGVLRNMHGRAAKWTDCPGCAKCEANGGMVLRKGGWRCTTAHEYVFQFVKSRDYYCDGEAVAEMAIGGTPGNTSHKGRSAYVAGDRHMRTKVGLADMCAAETRNPRSVWTLSSEPFRGAHFATFPTALPRRCIEASTSSAGCCAVCGSQYAPIVRTERVPTRPGTDSKVGKRGLAIEAGARPDRPSHPNIVGNRDPQRHVARTIVEGYRATCACAAADPVPAIVLDPYAGSGTTLQVAHHLGRSYIGIELNPDYVELIRQRINIPLKTSRKTARRCCVERRQRVLFGGY